MSPESGLTERTFPAGRSDASSDPQQRTLGGPDAAFTRDFHGHRRERGALVRRAPGQAVGVDYLSIEPQGPEKQGYPVHNTLLRANVVIIEGLDLRGIAAGDYELVCAPIKLLGGDGAPARCS